MRKSAWELVEHIGVDAGLCWVGDPCYCTTPDLNSHPAKTWHDFCNELGNVDVKQWNYKAGHPGLGVSVQSGYGDGYYPVYVKRVDDRIAEPRVVFI